MATLSEENYLKAIWKLAPDPDAGVSTGEIAAEVKTSAASVTDMLKKLAARKLITYQPYHGVSLTVQGQRLAADVVRRHRLWEVFLHEKLGFGWEEVHDIAEQLEHIHSEALTDRLDRFLGFPKTDPHGDRIPDKTGKISGPSAVPLSVFNDGEYGIISGVINHAPSFLLFLEKHGLKPGAAIEMKERMEFDDSMNIRVNGKKTMTLSRDASSSILVIRKGKKQNRKS
ncbi:MAG TPA: metal-dependent transcriptional regulator [Bacteroidia bacterium]|nr:metal-dependent transcriptional regulator [Bacteroidia bacterium]